MYYIDKIRKASYSLDNLKIEAKQAIVNALENGYHGYGADLHDYVFNSEFYTSNGGRAEYILEDIGVFDAINLIVEYEKDNFGKVTCDISNPIVVMSMLWYILGAETVDDLFFTRYEDDALMDAFDDCWNRNMTAEDCDKLLELMKKSSKCVGCSFTVPF